METNKLEHHASADITPGNRYWNSTPLANQGKINITHIYQVGAFGSPFTYIMHHNVDQEPCLQFE
jgi:hypothetical protein